MIVIRKAMPADASAIIDFQKEMAWESEQMTLVDKIITKGVETVFNEPSHGQYYVAEAEMNSVAGLRLYVETNNSTAQKTYKSLGMKSEHYRMYEWMKE